MQGTDKKQKITHYRRKTTLFQKQNLQHFLMMLIVFLIASLIGYLFQALYFPDTNIVVVYLLAVFVASWLAGRFIFGFIASLFATFLFNYLFTEPIFTFSVDDPSYIITFVTMTCIALITSTLTSYAKRSASIALEKEAETKAIYQLMHELTDAFDIHDSARILTVAIRRCFNMPVDCFGFNEVNKTEADVTLANGFFRIVNEQGKMFYEWSILGREAMLGMIRIPKEFAEQLSDSQHQLLRSMIESTALALDRFHSVEQQMKSRESSVKERYRANLLRSISHDIRTPLSSIIGTSEMLMGMVEGYDLRYELVKDIQKDADWLHSLVENILNLTRLQNGHLDINKQLEAVEEVIGEVITHMTKRAPEYDISVCVPDELLLVPMDAKLIKQVLINLLDNAIKYTSLEDEISIKVTFNRSQNQTEFKVKDSGIGICKQDLSKIFEEFYTINEKHADAKSGIGLGLAICEAVIKAHGGEISAHHSQDGAGTMFIFTLPMEEV